MRKAIETLTDMLVQRGYDVVEQQPDGEVTDLRLLGERVGEDGEPHEIVVFANPVEKFNVGCVKERLNVVNTLGLTHCIVVVESVTPVAKQLMSSGDIVFEAFSLVELQYNITKHELVPNHEKLGAIEEAAFKKKYGTSLNAIMRTDPVARFYNFQRGDIIRITHNFPGSPKAITYRIVKGR